MKHSNRLVIGNKATEVRYKVLLRCNSECCCGKKTHHDWSRETEYGDLYACCECGEERYI
jgi:hypothetical protein